MRGLLLFGVRALTPSLSMLDIIEGAPVHRMRRLVTFLFINSDAIALAVDRWMTELENWLDVVFGREIDRELRNHNPWGETGSASDPACFEQ